AARSAAALAAGSAAVAVGTKRQDRRSAMDRRQLFAAPALTACLVAGCLHPGAVRSDATVVTTPKPLTPPPAPELPPAVAADACLAAAEALARDGHNTEAILEIERARQFNPKVQSRTAHRLAVLYDRKGDSARA